MHQQAKVWKHGNRQALHIKLVKIIRSVWTKTQNNGIPVCRAVKTVVDFLSHRISVSVHPNPKQVASAMVVSKESISKFLLGNRFHAK